MVRGLRVALSPQFAKDCDDLGDQRHGAQASGRFRITAGARSRPTATATHLSIELAQATPTTPYADYQYDETAALIRAWAQRYGFPLGAPHCKACRASSATSTRPTASPTGSQTPARFRLGSPHGAPGA
ncbi:MAG: N-acetylmuramoyl-L-alanine amidase [Chloroflexota bacterium]|nr:MAG: N-acetylmuramoyl-L-alanine amidase [Chloroflexota bacterium]